MDFSTLARSFLRYGFRVVFIHSSDAPGFNVANLDVDIEALVILIAVRKPAPFGFGVFISHFYLAFAVTDWTQLALNAAKTVWCINPTVFAPCVTVAVGAGLT